MLPTQESVGLLIGAARRQLHLAVQSRVGRHRLSPPQFWTLLALREVPGASLGELAQRLRIDAPSASRLAASLQERRLLRMELDEADRRRSHLELTPAGKNLAEALLPVASAVRDAAVAGLDAREQQALREALLRILANLASFNSAKPKPAAVRARMRGRRAQAEGLGPA
jgi:DNA-binding MarR family transcriptional regulator